MGDTFLGRPWLLPLHQAFLGVQAARSLVVASSGLCRGIHATSGHGAGRTFLCKTAGGEQCWLWGAAWVSTASREPAGQFAQCGLGLVGQASRWRRARRACERMALGCWGSAAALSGCSFKLLSHVVAQTLCCPTTTVSREFWSLRVWVFPWGSASEGQRWLGMGYLDTAGSRLWCPQLGVLWSQ